MLSALGEMLFVMGDIEAHQQREHVGKTRSLVEHRLMNLVS